MTIKLSELREHAMGIDARGSKVIMVDTKELLRLLEIAEAARLLRKTKWGHKDWPHQIMDPLPCDVAATWEGLDKALEGVEP